jgi:hypothetical protein
VQLVLDAIHQFTRGDGPKTVCPTLSDSGAELAPVHKQHKQSDPIKAPGLVDLNYNGESGARVRLGGARLGARVGIVDERWPLDWDSATEDNTPVGTVK